MSSARLVLTLATLLALLPGAVRAGDFCIIVSPTDSTKYVGKGFKVPGPGKCKSWNGVYLPSFAAVSVSTGTGCTSSDGTTLRINLVTSRETVAFNDYIVLPLPELTNGTLAEIVPQFGNDTLNLTGITASKCNAKDNPIP
jgi:hypothetical protein